jgi:hypothetical protein
METVALRKVVPRSEQDYTTKCGRALTREGYKLQMSGGGTEGYTYKRNVCSVVLSMVISAAQLSRSE